jgi:transposase
MEAPMDVMHERCCGLDVHKKTVVACLITLTATRQWQKETRTFRTMTSELLSLLDWLKAEGCTHVAMESTGVYWKPIYNLLEGQMELLVVNAQHIKAVPGRKTDMNDAQWLARLLQLGLLKPSYIPSAPQRELRELTRHRTSVIEERARTVNRLQKTLEDTNIKLGDVISDVLGKSGRAMLEAIRDGEQDSKKLAALGLGRVRANQEELEKALQGHIKAHHRFMLSEHLCRIDELDAAIRRVTQEISRRMSPPDPPSEEESSGLLDGQTEPLPEPVEDEGSPLPQSEKVSEEQPEDQSEPLPEPVEDEGSPLPQGAAEHMPLTFQQAIQLVDAIPGINVRAAQGILAETGLNMQQFPSSKHFASWIGVCPGQNESAGKRKSGKTRNGNPALRTLLVQAAHAAAHCNNSYLAAQYRRIASRGGPKKAAMAVAHSIAVIIYHILRDQTTYEDLGCNYFDERDRQHIEMRLVRRLQRLGYQVELQPTAQAG